MGEVKLPNNRGTVAVRYRFVITHSRKNKTCNVRFEPEPLRDLTHELKKSDSSEEINEEDVVYEDDVTFLRSLDPKAWKDQDHYAVLGIKHLRIKATDEIIKTAYRKKVLKHHPDKRKAQGEEIRPDDDYFTCITKAYETLGTPLKRRSYDSVDPEFDDSLPSGNELKKDFFKVFGKYFDLNSRWSEKKNVPKLGDINTSREDVEKFYSFWYNFESWREFSYLDEEEKEKGQDREERRWIEKQNKAARAKRKKEEMARIRNLVDMAYTADPRIAKFKQEEKEKKEAARQAKREAALAKKEEEERLAREKELEKQKLEEEERQRKEAEKLEKEAQKKALKRERKKLRDFCKSNNYFTNDPQIMVSTMASMEKICEILPVPELEKLNSNMEQSAQPEIVFKEAVSAMESRLEEERRAILEKASKNQEKGDIKNVKIEWTTDSIQLLIKAVNIFPAGTTHRWEVIANFLNQHSGLTCFNARDVLSKAKDLQKSDFSTSNLKVAANDQAFKNFEKEHKLHSDASQTSAISTAQTNGTPLPTPWTAEEQKLLEQALTTYPASTPERWDRIAECIPDRGKKECMRRYKELVEIVRAKKAAQEAVAKQKK